MNAMKANDAQRRHRRRATTIARTVMVAIVAYSLAVFISFAVSSPFADAVEAVAARGGWDEQQVTFQRGSYAYRFVYAVAEIDARVRTSDGLVPVHLEMYRVPLLGWVVRRFEITS